MYCLACQTIEMAVKLISGITVPGSPVNIPVTVPVKMRNKPIKTITGLKKPRGVAVTSDGLLVVSESAGDCITIMDREGKKMKSFGSKGNGRGQLDCPQGVAITSKGTILVVDCGNHRIQEYTMEGDCISCIGTEGNGVLQFLSPTGITIHKTTGQVFIVELGNNRVQVLNPDFTFSHMFGGFGSGQGQFKCPVDVAIDNKGFLFVTDSSRIQKFTTVGQFVLLFKSDQYPSGITIDDNDLVYVNHALGAVSVFSTNGEQVGNIDKNIPDKNFPHISSCAVFQGLQYDNNTGYLYVCDCENVKIF